MEINLEHKRILVTGGSRGIGKAIVLKLVEAGASVLVHYQKNSEAARDLANQNPRQIHLFQADFNQPPQIRSLYDHIKQTIGGLDVLINNAGIALHTPMDADDLIWQQQWSQTLQVNLAAAAFLCKMALADFELQKQGIIINISSRAAFRGDTPEYLAYAASKGGLVSLTRSIARAYGKKGIVAFDVAPGFVKTDMAQDFIDHYGEDRILNDIALNELTKPQDLAPLVTLLASGLANHATGTTINVNAASYVH